jgi:hypothetical protein
MNIFGKAKSSDPEATFVAGLNTLVRNARRDGVARRVIKNNLAEHAASIDRELSAAIERRHYGDPNMKSGNLP